MLTYNNLRELHTGKHKIDRSEPLVHGEIWQEGLDECGLDGGSREIALFCLNNDQKEVYKVRKWIRQMLQTDSKTAVKWQLSKNLMLC